MPRLNRIKKEIVQLPDEELLWLLERMARHLRNSSARYSVDESQLAAMAADPEILRELRTIDEELRPTELDGLDRS